MWNNLSPTAKKNVVYGAGIVILLLLSGVVLSFGENSDFSIKPKTHDEPVTNLLTGTKTRKYSINQLSNEQAKQQSQINNLSTQFDNYQKQMKSYQDKQQRLLTNISNQLSNQEKMTREKFQNLTTEQQKLYLEQNKNKLQTNSRINSALTEMKQSKNSAPYSKTPVPASDRRTNRDKTPRNLDSQWKLFQNKVTEKPPLGASVSGKPDSVVSNLPKLYIYKQEESEEIPEPEATEEDEENIYLPSGTIIKTKILAGFYAPTGVKANKNPIPFLARVVDLSILPNRFRADMRECFIVAGGYGDRSTERAYGRIENISCVRNSGGVIDIPMKGWVVGEDGFQGIRGKIISRSGELLAKTAAAGVLAGFADIYKPQSYTGLVSTSETGLTTPDTGLAFKAGALGGVSNAMDRLADYYIDLAEQTFDVIEIGPTREVTFIVNPGVEFTQVEL